MVKRQFTDLGMDLLTAVSAVVLIVAVTYEVLTGHRDTVSSGYLWLQAAICVIFMADYFMRVGQAEQPWRYAWHNLVFLLLSIPYTSILATAGTPMTRQTAMLVCGIPLLRTFVAMYYLVRCVVRRWAARLLVSYITTVVLFTYLAALMFYDYEAGVNHALHGFGNALWWAGMGFTTVGAAIFPVTTVGKILAVLLPLGGMLMLPIFTAYVVNEYKHHHDA